MGTVDRHRTCCPACGAAGRGRAAVRGHHAAAREAAARESASRGRRAASGVATVLAMVAALALLVGTPSAARAADGITDTATTTYELVPADGVLRVTIELTVRNDIPSETQLVPCTEWAYDPWTGYYPITTTCPRTVDYYVDGSYVWLERAARSIRLAADRGRVTRSVERRLDEFIGYRLSFEPVYRGQERTVRVTYEVPGGAPRSASATRIGRAYANFCAFAHGLDGGNVRVVVPSAYETTVSPEPMAASPAGAAVVHRSGAIAETMGWYRCFEGTNEAGFARRELASPGGRSIVLEAWPEDDAWLDAVGAEVVAATTGLEALLGRALPGSGSITVRQVSDSELGDYAGTFEPATGIARISETYTEPGVVAHELSHAWFNLETLAARWLSEGLARWAERVSPTAGEPCGEPGPYPGRGSPDLDEWAPPGPRATDAERAVIGWSYDAACWITTSLAGRMGDQRMAEVVRGLLDRRAAYGDEPTDRRPGGGPADWRVFLDLVDEVGLVPAGVTDLRLAEELLLAYGVAEPAALAGRAEARAAFHALAADLGDWAMPDAIRVPLEAWSFAAAGERIATAGQTLELVAAADAALAGIDAADGPARAAFESAEDAAGLAVARGVAADQAAAAADVADALRVLARPLEPLEEIGMWGDDLAPAAAAAIAATRAADAAAAAAAAGEIRATLGRAAEVGTQRVAFGAGGALAGLLLLGGVVVLVRRRRRAPLVAAVAAEAVAAGAPEAAEPWAAPPAGPDEATARIDAGQPPP